MLLYLRNVRIWPMRSVLFDFTLSISLISNAKRSYIYTHTYIHIHTHTYVYIYVCIYVILYAHFISLGIHLNIYNRYRVRRFFGRTSSNTIQEGIKNRDFLAYTRVLKRNKGSLVTHPNASVITY